MISIVSSVLGSIAGGYLGVLVALTRIKTQVTQHDKIITLLDTVQTALVHRVVILEGDLNRMKVDIGTHDTGMRGQVHLQANMLSHHELRLHLIDKQPIKEL